MNTPYNQVTLNQMISIFSGISVSHGQIKSFYCGEIENYNDLLTIYPLMYVHYDNSISKLHETEMQFSVFVMDRLETDFANENEVYSDTLQIVLDIKSILKYGVPNYELLRVNDENQIEKVRHKFNSDIVCGSMIKLNIRTDYVYDVCSVPNK